MIEVFVIRVDTEDDEWLGSLDVECLFPEHYFPLLISSDEIKIVDVSLPEGKSRFIFHGQEVECHFEYYDNEKLGNEWDEHATNAESPGGSLVEYVVDEILSHTGYTARIS